MKPQTFHTVALTRARRMLTQRYGAEFYKSFQRESTELLAHMLPDLPAAGRGLFTFSLVGGECWIVWYKTLRLLGLTGDEATADIWRINECLADTLPRWCMRLAGKAWLRSLKRTAREQSGAFLMQGWRAEADERAQGALELSITECPLRELAHSFGADRLFPAVCRMDYLYASRMGYGFARTCTLADGDACCVCRYQPGAVCEWAPEKGFDTRK